MSHPADETDLIQRARAGEEHAFRALVERYTSRVYALVRNMVKDASEAEDVTQEVFFKVYAKLESFREDSSFYTWLYRVAFNTATDHIKRRRHEREVQVEDFAVIPVADDAGSPDEDAGRRDLRAEVRSAMARLPEKFRTILVLRELEGLAYEEISTVLGIAIGTVESRIFRAREKLKRLLELRPHQA